MSNDNTPAAITLINDVKTEVKSRAANMRGRIVSELADKEENRRADIIHGGLTKRKDLDAEIKKMKGSHLVGIDQETGKETFHFTKKELEERNKKVKKLEKLDDLIGKALDPENGNLADAIAKLKDFK